MLIKTELGAHAGSLGGVPMEDFVVLDSIDIIEGISFTRPITIRGNLQVRNSRDLLMLLTSLFDQVYRKCLFCNGALLQSSHFSNSKWLIDCLKIFSLQQYERGWEGVNKLPPGSVVFIRQLCMGFQLIRSL